MRCYISPWQERVSPAFYQKLEVIQVFHSVRSRQLDHYFHFLFMNLLLLVNCNKPMIPNYGTSFLLSVVGSLANEPFSHENFLTRIVMCFCRGHTQPHARQRLLQGLLLLDGVCGIRLALRVLLGALVPYTPVRNSVVGMNTSLCKIYDSLGFEEILFGFQIILHGSFKYSYCFSLTML